MRLFISSDLPNFSPAGPAEQSSLQQTTANVATKFNFTDMSPIMGNETSSAPPASSFDLRIHPLAIMVAASITIFCVCANLFTILVLIRFSPLKSISTLYILSLSLADCLIGSLVMPVMLLNEITSHFGDFRAFTFGPLWLCKAWQLADILLSTISLYSICAIALDRVWNLEKPLRVFKRSHSRAKRLVLAVWLIPTLIWTAIFCLLTNQLDGDGCLPRRDVASRIYVIAIPLLYIPMITLIAAFIRISFAVSRHFKFLREHSSKALLHLTTSASVSSAFNPRTCSIASAPTNLKASRLKTNAHHHSSSPQLRTKTLESLQASALPKNYMLTPPSSPCSPRFPREMTDSMGWTISSHIHTLSFEDEHIPARKSSPMILIGECEPNTIPDQNENGDEAPSSSDEANCLEIQPRAKDSLSSHTYTTTLDSTRSEPFRKERLLQRLSLTFQRKGSSRFSMTAMGDLLQREGLSQQMKAAKAVGFILLCFLICWFPFLLTWPIKVFCPGDTCISDRTYRLSIWLNYLGSTLNPILYALSNPKVLTAIKEWSACFRILGRKRKGNSNVTFL